VGSLMLAAKYGEVGPAPVDTLIGLATNQGRPLDFTHVLKQFVTLSLPPPSASPHHI